MPLKGVWPAKSPVYRNTSGCTACILTVMMDALRQMGATVETSPAGSVVINGRVLTDAEFETLATICQGRATAFLEQLNALSA